MRQPFDISSLHIYVTTHMMEFSINRVNKSFVYPTDYKVLHVVVGESPLDSTFLEKAFKLRDNKKLLSHSREIEIASACFLKFHFCDEIFIFPLASEISQFLSIYSRNL